MSMPRILLYGIVTLAGSISAVHAGPCSGAIDAMQARVDAKLEANAAAGPMAKQGTAAGMSVQPTPRSIAAAEEKLGEISSQKVAAIRQGMTRARAADAKGNNDACKKALANVQRALGP